MERFCPGCGTQRADGASFCGQCGHQFATVAPGPESPAAPASAPPLAAAPPVAAAPAAASAALPPAPGSASASGSSRIIFLIFGLVLIVFGLYRMLHGLGVIGGHSYSSSYGNSYSYGSGSHSAGALIFLGVFLLLTGGGFFIWGLMKQSKTQASAAIATAWPAVPGVVVSSGVTDELPIAALFAAGAGAPGRSRYFLPHVRYRYTVGRDYEGTRIRFGSLNCRSSAAARAIVQPYPANAPVMVRYDPANPAESVLELQTSSGNAKVAIVFGVIMALGGLLLLALGPALR